MHKPELLARTKRFALAIINFHEGLDNRPANWILGKQLLRSGTSIGANYREAQRARSRAEFGSKVAIAAQEADETGYWLELLLESKLSDVQSARQLLQEANELAAILTSISSSVSLT